MSETTTTPQPSLAERLEELRQQVCQHLEGGNASAIATINAATAEIERLRKVEAAAARFWRRGGGVGAKTFFSLKIPLDTSDTL